MPPLALLFSHLLLYSSRWCFNYRDKGRPSLHLNTKIHCHQWRRCAHVLRKSQIERTRRRVAKKCVDEHETEKKNKSLDTEQPVTAGVVECKCIALHSTLFLQRWSCVLPFLFHSPSLTEKIEREKAILFALSCAPAANGCLIVLVFSSSSSFILPLPLLLSAHRLGPN